MKQSGGQRQMSPVNIDQARTVGQDSPAEGSGMGREANKSHGYPGEEGQANVGQLADASSPEGHTDADESQASTHTRDEAIRQAAYEAYLRRNGAPGDATSDRLEAEAKVNQQGGA